MNAPNSLACFLPSEPPSNSLPPLFCMKHLFKYDWHPARYSLRYYWNRNYLSFYRRYYVKISLCRQWGNASTRFQFRTLIAVLVSLVTILISAWLPARRATKYSAIQAIRQNKDIAILPEKLRSKLTQKLDLKGYWHQNYNVTEKVPRYSNFFLHCTFISAAVLCLPGKIYGQRF